MPVQSHGVRVCEERKEGRGKKKKRKKKKVYRSTFKLKEGRSYFKNKSNRPLFIQRYLKKNRVIEISLKSLYRNLLFVIFLTLSKRTFSLFFFFFFLSISGEKKSKFPTLLLFSTDEFVLYIRIYNRS